MRVLKHLGTLKARRRGRFSAFDSERDFSDRLPRGEAMKTKTRHALGLFLCLCLWLWLSAFAATVDGLKIHSSVAGKGAKTVILVHGWTCDDSSWSEQIAALSKDYRVVTLDLPGHGRSDSPKDGKFSMDLFARAVESVRAEAKADRVVLVGHSMGTPVIVRYAQLYPQHTVGLVFVDGVTPGIVPPPSSTASASVGSPGDAMGGPDGRKNREAMIRSLFTPATAPAIQTRVLNMMLAAPEATAVGAMNATFDPAGQSNAVLTLPILAVYADHSRLNNPDFLVSHYPHLDYTEIPGTGHFLMLEKPDEFNSLLLAFLAKQTF
jgi:sigma-B regulation protein RsbQ